MRRDPIKSGPARQSELARLVQLETTNFSLFSALSDYSIFYWFATTYCKFEMLDINNCFWHSSAVVNSMNYAKFEFTTHQYFTWTEWTQSAVLFSKIEPKPCLLVKLAIASKTIIAVRHFGLGGRESLEAAVIWI